MRRPALAALAALGVVLVATAAPTASADAEAQQRPAKGIEVRLDGSRGARFTDWGFDLKQGCRPCPASVARKLAHNPDYARAIFGSGKISVVRIALRTDEAAVDARGHLQPGWYADTVQAVANIRAANPAVKIYASRSTVTHCEVREDRGRCMDFAPGLKAGGTHGRVLAWKYGRLLAEYLRYMNGHGVPVSVLGIENEPTNNEANLTPARFLATIRALDANYAPRLPRLEANSPGNPDPGWFDSASHLLYRRLSILTIHSHPDRWDYRQRQPAAQTVRIARSRGLAAWNTELHWTGAPTPYAGASRAVSSVLNQVNAGVTGIVWWGYRPRGTGTATSQIQNALVDTLDDSRSVRTGDWDGDAARLGTLTSRAFVRGSSVYLWVVNDSRSFLEPAHHLRRPPCRNVLLRALVGRAWWSARAQGRVPSPGQRHRDHVLPPAQHHLGQVRPPPTMSPWAVAGSVRQGNRPPGRQDFPGLSRSDRGPFQTGGSARLSGIWAVRLT